MLINLIKYKSFININNLLIFLKILKIKINYIKYWIPKKDLIKNKIIIVLH